MAYDAEVLADAPLAYYRLGEASGTTLIDSSGNSRNGTYGGTVPTPVAGLLTGDPDGARDFAGGWAHVPPATWMDTSGTLTAEAWVAPDAGNGDRIIVSRTNWMQGPWGDQRGWALAIINNRWFLAFSFTDGSYHDVAIGPTPVMGTRYHVAVTWDANPGILRFYLDGAEVYNSGAGWNGKTLRNPSTSGLGIAREEVYGYIGNWDGRIDEVAVYGTALSPERIAAHYTAGLTEPDPEPEPEIIEVTGALAGSGTLSGQAESVEQEPPEPATYPDLVLADGPLGYWRMRIVPYDNPSGYMRIEDATGQERHVTVSGAVSGYRSEASLTSDPTDPSAYFGGGGASTGAAGTVWGDWIDTYHRFTVTTLFQVYPGSGIRTLLEHWGRSTSASATQRKFQLRLNGTKLELLVGTTPEVLVTSTIDIAASVIYHVVATYDGTNARLYINGALDAEQPASGNLDQGRTNPGQLNFGRSVFGSEWSLGGMLDEVALFDKALPAERAVAYFEAAGVPTPEPPVVDASGYLSGSGTLSGLAEVDPGPDPDPPDPEPVVVEVTGQLGGVGTLAYQPPAPNPAQLDVQLPTLEFQTSVQVGGGMRRWRFGDRVTGEMWEVPINPNEMGSPFAPRNLSLAHGTKWGHHRIRALDLAPGGPAAWTFSGVIRSRAHHDQLQYWANKNRPVLITDHLGRTFEVLIQSFAPEDRRPTPNVPWRLKYSMTCLVIKESV